MSDLLNWRSSGNDNQETSDQHQHQQQPVSSQLVAFNFSRANVQVQPTVTPPSKTFLIKKKGDVIEKTITFYLGDCNKVFEKACRMYKIITKENYVLHYPLRQADGTSRRMTLSMDEFIEEQCTSFYRTCEEYSLLLLEEVIVSKARPLKPHECLFKTIMTKNFTVDDRFYATLAEHPVQLCEKFLEKRNYISLLLGRECGNLLNHGYYLCHIRGCQKLIKFGSFCNLTLMISHIRRHSKDGNECAQTLMRRHCYLTQDSKQNWKKVHHLEKEIDQLNQSELSQQSLAVNTSGMFFVENGLKFKGAHLLLDVEIVFKLAIGDKSALNLTDIPSTSKQIQSFYTKKSELAFKSQTKAKSADSKAQVDEELPGRNSNGEESDGDEDEDVNSAKKKNKSICLSSSDEDDSD